MTDLHDAVVVGAGAAGLWAAEVAARGGAEVLLLEKTPRAGTKVLASGGTHCNLTTTLGPDAAAALFGRRGERFLRRGFRQLSPEAVRERFHEWGVATVQAPLEKIFPESGRARDVRDALQGAAARAGVRLRTGAGVAGIEAREGGGYWVQLFEGEPLAARRLVLAPGGMSYPRTGTTGDGYRWCAQLDLPLVEPVPALAPLSSPEPWVHALAGIAVQDVEVRLLGADGKERARRRRPLLFTHRGVSGPGPMDVSGVVARERSRGLEGHRLVCDWAPQRSREELTARLRQASSGRGEGRVERALELALPKRLWQRIAGAAGLRGNPSARGLSRSERHALVEALKAFPIPVDGTLGFDAAEVTAGGLALEALDPGSLEVRGRPGLYVCGELLDLDGPIGGLNFQAAFATAELVGRALG